MATVCVDSALLAERRERATGRQDKTPSSEPLLRRCYKKNDAPSSSDGVPRRNVIAKLLDR